MQISLDEYKIKIDSLTKENIELRNKIKIYEEECKSLEMKCSMAVLKKEKGHKSSGIYSRDTKETERSTITDTLITTYLSGERNSRNYVKSTSGFTNRSQSTNKTPFELIYRSRVTPIGERACENVSELSRSKKSGKAIELKENSMLSSSKRGRSYRCSVSFQKFEVCIINEMIIIIIRVI